MKRVSMFAVAALAMTVGAASTLVAQAPNFGGKWAQVVDPNAAGGRGRGGFGGLGAAPTIVQDATTLTITTPGANGGADVKTVYKLDGSDSKNSRTAGQNTIESTSNAKWDGGKLVVTTKTSFGGNDFTSKATWAMDASGNLVITSENPGFNGGAATTTTTTYKKG